MKEGGLLERWGLFHERGEIIRERGYNRRATTRNMSGGLIEPLLNKIMPLTENNRNKTRHITFK